MSINKVILVARLCKDPEKRTMPNGGSVTNVSMATNESWTDKASGQKMESVEFHNVVFFRGLADIAEQYLKKGSQVYIEGKLKTRKYQDKTNGEDRYSTTIIVDQMQMLGGKSGSSQGQPQQRTQQQQQDKPKGNGGYSPSDGGFNEFDDDIPF